MVSVLRDGYSLEFDSKPPLSTTPTVRTFSTDPVKQDLLQSHIQELLAKNAIERVSQHNTPGFYSRIFLVPKRTGDMRPVIDLSVLNQYIKSVPFRMETAESIRASLRPGMWTFSVDLSDAFFHIPIHPASRKFLRLEFQGEVYQFRVLPFGVKIAPWLFTTVFKEVKPMAWALGVPLHQYMDDWLGTAMDAQTCRIRASAMIALCRELGIRVNPKKSDLVPRQVFDFLGYHFNLITFQVCPTVANTDKVIRMAQLLVQEDSLPAHMWQVLIGVLASQDKLIPYGRLHVRPLQLHLLSRWNPFHGNPQEAVAVPLLVKRTAYWWMTRSNLIQGLPVAPLPPTVRLYTDASTVGWGAHCGEQEFSGLWLPRERLLHINVLEMRAIRLALDRLKPSSGDQVLVSTDNSTVVAYINHQGGTRSLPLWEETSLLFEFLMAHQVQLRAVHIPGRLNVIADQLSRAGQTLPTEWSIRPEALQEVFRRWGKPLVDLFATRHNRKCDLFVSPVPDPLALATDALSFDWDGIWGYAYPPHQIMTKVLRKFRSHQGCQVILIAPKWPKQAWFPDLMELQVEHLPIPCHPKLLKQPRMQVFHRCPEMLSLHAWLLKGKL